MSKKQYEQQAADLLKRRPTPPIPDQPLTELSKTDLQEICISKNISFKDKDNKQTLIKKLEGI